MVLTLNIFQHSMKNFDCNVNFQNIIRYVFISLIVLLIFNKKSARDFEITCSIIIIIILKFALNVIDRYLLVSTNCSALRSNLIALCKVCF